ncbi:Hexokinase-7 [Dictyocoela muelleri]|nr:Hexokinase-7 [Dictyocoela muelleri]
MVKNSIPKFFIFQFVIPFLMCCFDYNFTEKIKIVENFNELIKESEMKREANEKRGIHQVEKVTVSEKNYGNDSKSNDVNLISGDTKSDDIKFRDISTEDNNDKKCLNDTNNMFINTHVPLKPCNLENHENKIILAVDIGGSFLKINIFKVQNKNLISGKEQKHSLTSDDYFSDTSIFEFTAEKIKKYLENTDDESLQDFLNFDEKYAQDISRGDEKYTTSIEIPISLTFSHPVIHISLSSAKVISFNKNFKFKIEKDADPVARLNEELEKLEIYFIKKYFKLLIKPEVKVLLNDTTATAATGYQNEIKSKKHDQLSDNKFYENDLVIGIVLGTGTNGAYTDIKNNVIINTEWASLDKNIFRLTKYDEKIRKEVLGEKSGIHKLTELGKILRNNIIFRRVENSALFKAFSNNGLLKKREEKEKEKEKEPIVKEKYNCLDCLCGGYKFVDLVNKAISGELNIHEKFDLERILRITDNPQQNDEREKRINEIVSSIKRRTSSIISSLIFGIVLRHYENLKEIYFNHKEKNVSSSSLLENNLPFNNFKVTLFLNGTLFHNDRDLDVLKYEVEELSKIYKEIPYDRFNFVVAKNASLEGGVYVLLNEIE